MWIAIVILSSFLFISVVLLIVVWSENDSLFNKVAKFSDESEYRYKLFIAENNKYCKVLTELNQAKDREKVLLDKIKEYNDWIDIVSKIPRD